jgi:hypothetical protein
VFSPSVINENIIKFPDGVVVEQEIFERGLQCHLMPDAKEYWDEFQNTFI